MQLVKIHSKVWAKSISKHLCYCDTNKQNIDKEYKNYEHKKGESKSCVVANSNLPYPQLH